MMTQTYTSVPISILRSGTILESPLFDEKQRKLLAAGLIITDTLLQQVRRRGITSVRVEKCDLSRVYSMEPQGIAAETPPARRGIQYRLETATSIALDAEAGAMTDLTAGPQGEPFSRQVRQPASQLYGVEEQARFVEEHEESLHEIMEIMEQLCQRREPDLDQLETISDHALERTRVDKDLFVCHGITPYYSEYPGRHSMHTASLAIAMGATLQLDTPTIRDLAVGCLIHDFGMSRIDPNSYRTQRRLDDLEFLEITKHPLLTFEMLNQGSQEISARSRMVAYQLHERCNGSGYPRGRMAEQTHDLAKIAAVADTYVALVAPRPHRPGMLPYFAMEQLLHDVKGGLYDAVAVRALLETVCLFPIGSYVELNDSRVGRVIRSNGTHYDRPILEVWNRETPHKDPNVLDLASECDYQVTRPLGSIA